MRMVYHVTSMHGILCRIMRGGGGGERGGAYADIMHQDSLLPCLPPLCVLVYSLQLSLAA